ncbi:VRR-NUC domain-containing protein [Candidatus Dojkabacteria bacterium]|uniref:VRR-NUC domain-containing protein n=1 Tax=Candidatus Dojkabacteria bacterium TaxID=2099670 RepID=A0A5C7JC15_9BACT|nr:MAG: VRR-NUC domain-containing protein [Candidatus Dojkabacteria bacterium]
MTTIRKRILATQFAAKQLEAVSAKKLTKVAKKLLPTEQQIQNAVMDWIRLQKFNFYLIKKRLSLIDYAWHTPNGGSRNIIEAKRLKDAGVLSGVPDITIAVPSRQFHAFYMELKSSKGKLSPAQIKFAHNMKSVGNYYCVAYSVNEAIEFIKAYMGDMLCTAQ